MSKNPFSTLIGKMPYADQEKVIDSYSYLEHPFFQKMFMAVWDIFSLQIHKSVTDSSMVWRCDSYEHRTLIQAI